MNRMPRLARNNIETPYCHVIVQGINKEYIFKEMKNPEKSKTKTPSPLSDFPRKSAKN